MIKTTNQLLSFSCIALTLVSIPNTYAQDSSLNNTEAENAEKIVLPHNCILTAKSGRELDVVVLSYSGNALSVRRQKDGKIFQIPLNKLSEEDQTLAQSLPKTEPLFVGIPTKKEQINNIEALMPGFVKMINKHNRAYLGRNLERDASEKIENAKEDRKNAIVDLAFYLDTMEARQFPDSTKVVFDLLRLAQQENSEAIVADYYNFFALYNRPNTIPKEYVQAAYDYTVKQANSDNLEAMLALAFCHLTGHNLPDSLNAKSKKELKNEGQAWCRRVMDSYDNKKTTWSYKQASALLEYGQPTLMASYDGVEMPIHQVGSSSAKNAIVYYPPHNHGYNKYPRARTELISAAKPLLNAGWAIFIVDYPLHDDFCKKMPLTVVKQEEEMEDSGKFKIKKVRTPNVNRSLHKLLLNTQYEQFSFVGSIWGAGTMLTDLNKFPNSKINSIVVIRPEEITMPSVLPRNPNTFTSLTQEVNNDPDNFSYNYNKSTIKWIAKQQPIMDNKIHKHGHIQWKKMPEFYRTMSF